MTNFDKIKNAVERGKKTHFNTNMLTENIMAVSFLTNGNQTKYLIFEPASIYTSTNVLISFLDDINKFQMNRIPPQNLLRIPFFSGFNKHDLAHFLGNKIFAGLDPELDIKINFDINPADFNIAGAKRFCRYLEYIYQGEPRYRSNNNFSNYVEYFLSEIQKKDFRGNIVLPLDYKNLCPTNKAIEYIFKEIEKLQQKD